MERIQIRVEFLIDVPREPGSTPGDVVREFHDKFVVDLVNRFPSDMQVLELQSLLERAGG